MKNISQALDQYTGICKEALQDCASKLSKSFESVIIEVLLLYMVIPGKINFTQMGRYGRHCEQCYRQNFGRLRSKSLNWLLKLTDLVVADAFFSTRTFYEGFSMNSLAARHSRFAIYRFFNELLSSNSR